MKTSFPLKRSMILPGGKYEALRSEIEGSPELRRKIRDKFLTYADIFSCELTPDPADLPPMRLEVDGAKWHTRRHRGPARPQSVENQQKTIRQVNNMTKARVIKPLQATEYSQVLLTPKPNGKKRFCIDFRMFNLYCMRNGWSIPKYT